MPDQLQNAPGSVAVSAHAFPLGKDRFKHRASRVCDNQRRHLTSNTATNESRSRTEELVQTNRAQILHVLAKVAARAGGDTAWRLKHGDWSDLPLEFILKYVNTRNLRGISGMNSEYSGYMQAE